MGTRGWTTRFGFYLAAIGSACGLGNLWRFPFVVGDNGGGAFVLLYVLFCFVIGLPLLMGELILGKIKRRSAVMSFAEEFGRKKSKAQWVGLLGIFLAVVVLSYYAVISGWVLHFLVQFLTELVAPSGQDASLSSLLKSGPLQIGLASVHLLIALIIIMKGFADGLERTVAWVMPIFALLLVFLFSQALSLPGVPHALRLMFYPDFSQLKADAIIRALGQVCFTLSVGFGVMVTFGSHLSEEVHLPTAAFRVMALDTVLSLLSGLLVFSVALSASQVPISDPGLLFESLPKFIVSLPGGILFGIGFFLCLYFAALAASISLMESAVSNLIDMKWGDRTKAAWTIGLVALFGAVLPAMSSTVFESVRFSGKGVLELMDSIVVNWFLPPVAAILGWLLIRKIPLHDLQVQIVKDDQPETRILFPYWVFILKYWAPAIVTLGLALQIASILMN